MCVFFMIVCSMNNVINLPNVTGCSKLVNYSEEVELSF